MGALGIQQEKSAGKDVEQSTTENIDFDCRIFKLKSTKILNLQSKK